MIHTPHGVYCVKNKDTQFSNLIPAAGGHEEEYEVPELGYISSCTAFNQYFFCSLGTDIYTWDGEKESANVLEGTYQPDYWRPNKQYNVGDIVRPTDGRYNGYIYRCIKQGVSSSTEPNWSPDLSNPVKEKYCHWIGCGSLEAEGNSAVSLRAQSIQDYKDFLFIANTEEDGQLYPARLRWSQWQNPRLWHNNEDGSGMAGYVDVNDIEGKIVAIKKIGDILAVYKERGIVAITYSGGDTVFSKELITTKAGLVSPDAIIVLPHTHIFVGKDNIYQFDGNTVVPIGDPIRNYFFNDLKSIDRILGYYNETSKDIVFAYDNTDTRDNNRRKAITYNTYTHAWSVRDMGVTAIGDFCENDDLIIDELNTWAVEPEHEAEAEQMSKVDPTLDELEWNTDTTDLYDSPKAQELMIDDSLYRKEELVPMVGDKEGNVYKLSDYTDSRYDGQDGRPDGYDGWVISKTHHMEDPLHIKRLMRIQFHVETQGDYDLYVKIRPSWNAETPKEQINWEDAPSFTLNFRNSNTQQPVEPPFIDVDLSARYFQIMFGTKHNNEYFKVLGYTLFYQTRGER